MGVIRSLTVVNGLIQRMIGGAVQTADLDAPTQAALTLAASALQAGNNLSDVVNPAAAKTNLGLAAGCVYAGIVTQVINNTAAETSTLATGGAGSMTISAGTWKVGRVYRLRAAGTYQTPLLPSTVTTRVRLGGTVLASNTIAANVLATSSTTNYLFGEATITCRSVGVTGSVVIDGYMEFATAATVVAKIPMNSLGAPVTVNTTVATLLDLTSQWSAAQAGQGSTVTTTILEQVY